MSDPIAVPSGPRPRQILLLIGAVASGKGTQAEALSAHLDIPHLASGDLFRAGPARGHAAGRARQDLHGSRRARSRRHHHRHVHGGAGQAAGLPRRDPGRVPAHGRPGGGAGPDAGRPGGEDQRRHLHRGAQRGAGGARRRPLRLPDRRDRLPRRLRPAGHARASATATARRWSSATTTGRRSCASGWPTRCRRCSTSSSTTRKRARCTASTACSRSMR